MDSGRFKKCGYECIEWAIKYMETLDDRKPLPNVQPGWLWDVCPPNAPEKPEAFDKIMRDIEPVVLDGVLTETAHINVVNYILIDYSLLTSYHMLY